MHRDAGAPVEFEHDDDLLVLHGRVLEYFRAGAAWESQRMHVRHLAVYESPPDRRDRIHVAFGSDRVDFPRVTFKLGADRVEEMRRFVAACRRARDGGPAPADAKRWPR